MRPALLKLHRRVGLLLGLLWAIQGLTGAMLMFAPELDRMTMPRSVTGSVQSADKLVAAVAPLARAGRISRLVFADARHDRILVYFVDRAGVSRAAIVNTADSRVLAVRELNPVSPFGGSMLRWIYLVHISLRGGDRGILMVGTSGLFLLSTAIIGLWLGLPRRGTWRTAFAAGRWWQRDQQLYGWHRATGVLAGLAIVVMTTTGASMVFSTSLRATVSKIFPYQQTYDPVAARQGSKGPPDPTQRFIGPQRAIDIATARFPRASWTRLFLPAKDALYYAIELRQPDEHGYWMGRTAVTIGAIDGHIVQAYDPLRAPLANRVLDAALPIHDGTLVGLPARLLIMFAGLSLPALYITGIWRWWRRASRKGAIPRRKSI